MGEYTIKCKVGDNTYETNKLLVEDFLNLGATLEEKVFPFFTCFTACIVDGVPDSELLKCLYTSCKDVFKKEDSLAISKLVMNRDTLKINGKKVDEAEFNKHWLNVGYTDYRVVSFYFIKGNLGNFTSLLQLMPDGATKKIKSQVEKKLSILLTGLSERLNK